MSNEAGELASSLPEECFFPRAIDDALNPDTWRLEESEQETTDIYDEELRIKIKEFMGMTRSVKSHLRDCPVPNLRELGFDSELPKKGSHIDILRLISLPKAEGEAVLVRSGGETVTVEKALGSKRYIILCCVFVPVLKPYGFDLRGLSSATIELKELHGDDFVQTVLVPYMLPGLEDNKGAFDRLFDEFPGCLAVPFEDIERRNSICMMLNLRDSAFRVTAILLDSLTHEVLLNDDIIPFLGVWGAALYPFTKERIEELSSRLWDGHYSLEYLLDCSSSHFFERLSGELVQVSELRNKYVGLYLYVKGRDSIESVRKAYNCYKDRGLEILIVPIPLHDNENPNLFQQIVKRALLRFGSLDWFLLPFKDFTSRKLLHLFPQKKDHLVIMDPVKKVLDHFGLEVIKEFGVTNSFPFTRDHIIQTKFDKFRGLTLKTLLAQSCLYRNNNPSNLYSSDCLDSGIVYVHFSREEGGCAYLDNLKDLVQELKSAAPEYPFEVVVVLWAPTTLLGDDHLNILSKESWLICRVDENGKPPSAVVDLASEKNIYPRGGLLSFLNGKLCTIDVSGVGTVLEPHSLDESLRLEVIKSMVNHGLDFMDLDVSEPYTLKFCDADDSESGGSEKYVQRIKIGA